MITIAQVFRALPEDDRELLSMDGGRGGAISYANSAVEVRLEGKDYVARVKDPFADHEKYSSAFRAVGLSSSAEEFVGGCGETGTAEPFVEEGQVGAGLDSITVVLGQWDAS